VLGSAGLPSRQFSMATLPVEYPRWTCPNTSSPSSFPVDRRSSVRIHRTAEDQHTARELRPSSPCTAARRCGVGVLARASTTPGPSTAPRRRVWCHGRGAGARRRGRDVAIPRSLMRPTSVGCDRWTGGRQVMASSGCVHGRSCSAATVLTEPAPHRAFTAPDDRPRCARAPHVRVPRACRAPPRDQGIARRRTSCRLPLLGAASLARLATVRCRMRPRRIAYSSRSRSTSRPPRERARPAGRPEDLWQQRCHGIRMTRDTTGSRCCQEHVRRVSRTS
jgi:hypothetical protein